MIITITGKAGSGKSTVAKMIAKKLNYPHYSMGDLQRELAKKVGVSIEELAKLEKEDRTYDDMIDNRQKEIGKDENAVVDSRLGALMIPKSLKIFLDVDINIAVKRRMNQEIRSEEEFNNSEEAKESMINRERMNQERFIMFYDYDFLDMKNYNLIINTTDLTPEEIVDQILKKLNTTQSE